MLIVCVTPKGNYTKAQYLMVQAIKRVAKAVVQAVKALWERIKDLIRSVGERQKLPPADYVRLPKRNFKAPPLKDMRVKSQVPNMKPLHLPRIRGNC